MNRVFFVLRTKIAKIGLIYISFLFLPFLATAEQVKVLKNGAVVRTEYSNCKALLIDFELLEHQCDYPNISEVTRNRFQDFAYCVSVSAETYPKGDRFDDFYLIPLHCAETQILNASLDPQFKTCMSTVYPLYVGYETAMRIPNKCSLPEVLESDQAHLINCLKDRISNGSDIQGSLGSLMAIEKCAD